MNWQTKSIAALAAISSMLPALGWEPLWESDTIVAEPVIFIAAADGTAPAGQLLATPVEMVQATNSDGSVTYAEGRDFTVDYATGVVALTADSRITPLLASELYPEAGAPRSYGKKLDSDLHMFYSEDSYLPDRQVRFTYKHQSADLPQPPAVRYGAMPQVEARLAAGEPVKFFVYGDSISVGCNATAFIKIPPFEPAQYERFAQFLRENSDSDISWHNFAHGGRNAEWGLENISCMVNAAETPDFIVLAWGMNDASADFSGEKLAGLVQAQMKVMRDRFPGVEFLLLTSMPANENWQYAGSRHFPEFSEALRQLADDNGVLVADATPVWLEIVKRKGFMSLTGNGLNHPNDFGHRIYADVLIDAITK